MRSDQFRAGAKAALLLISCLYATPGHGQEQAPVPAVDTTDRQQVTNLYRNYYLPDNDLDPGWTGDVGAGIAGTLSEDYLGATLERINYYRAMSGVSSALVFTAEKDSQCQQAALMMAGQQDISHTPGTDWKFYTNDAALGAANSNIRLDDIGDEGPGAVDRFMAEIEPNNYGVGHRRWFIYPAQGDMGAGAVPPSEQSPGTAAIWVLDYHNRSEDGTLSTSWPPRGFVPANLVFDRWSFSYPDADFSAANISVTKGDAPMAITVEEPEGSSSNGSAIFVGDNTIVWHLPANVVSLTADETYAVHLDNVLLGGVPREFDYTVTSIDADPPPLSTVNVKATVSVAHRQVPASGKIKLFRDGDISAPLTISYAISGNAIPGLDYEPLSGTISFDAGKAVAKIKVLPITPGRHGKKIVTVTLQPDGTFLPGDPLESSVTIAK